MCMKGKKPCLTSAGKNLSQEVTITRIFKQICSCMHAVLPNGHEGKGAQTKTQPATPPRPLRRSQNHEKIFVNDSPEQDGFPTSLE